MSVKDRILAAMIEHEEAKPRNQQVRLGPSELGGCREYVRNVMVGTPQQSSSVWPTAAVVGTLIGSHMEAVCEERLGALTEVPVTTTLPNGLRISGHADIVFVDDNVIVDCKSKDRFDTVTKEGPSLDNAIQISVYALGLVQAGVLTEGCTASLVYVDRSGEQQFLHEVEFTWDQMQRFIELCIERLNSVIEAQDLLESGVTTAVHELRDKTPPFCYSERVMCPFRDACWKGSEWVPNESIEDPEIIRAVEMYAANREEIKGTDTIRRELRERLIGVSGVTPSGLSVKWAEGKYGPMLYVTQVGEKS